MTVEVATTIATLDSALPAATDPKSEGDDHIRLIKTVLKANVVSGPASSTDNTLPRFDGTTGKVLQGSGVVVDDSNNVGIGGTPFQKLHVYGNMRLDPGVGTALLQVVHTGTAYRDLHIDAAGTYHINGTFGYGAGAGGTVTQATSRTTGVALNKPSGAITMFSAAGSATRSQFFFSNSFISATDTVAVSVKQGASNYYLIDVVDVQAGGCVIVFATTGSTAIDAPVINFAIIKGSTT